jgi:hypothetical protein
MHISDPSAISDAAHGFISSDTYTAQSAKSTDKFNVELYDRQQSAAFAISGLSNTTRPSM